MKVWRKIADVALILMTLTAVAGAIFAVTHDLSFATVTSRSMEPAMKAGDLIMTTQAKRTDLKERDIVLLSVPDLKNLRYSHRIVNIETKAQSSIIRTKGDSNPAPDAWTLSITSDRVPRVLGVIPTAWIFDSPFNRSAIFSLLLTVAFALIVLAFLRVARGASQKLTERHR